MKVSMQLTLDGLLRALRWRAHNIAEEIALSRDARPAAQGSGRRRAARSVSGMGDRRDDRARR
jgi:hypothetical protein